MKIAAPFLAALLVVSAPAFAETRAPGDGPSAHAGQTVRTPIGVPLDRTVTNSTAPSVTAKEKGAASEAGAPAGNPLSVNPWIVPSFH